MDGQVVAGRSFLALLTLERSRALIRSRVGLSLAIGIGFVYAFVSMLVGQMIVFGPTGQTSTSVTVLTASSSSEWWNFPALLVLAPGGLIALPFLPTVTMVIVSVGVGIGMTVGVLLAVRLLRLKRQAPTGSGLASSAAGLTPALLALITLGACCSTTAATAAGIGAVAQASGQSLTAVFQNTWYLGIFQIAVLGVALVAQEQLVILYAVLTGESRHRAEVPSSTARSLAVWSFRLLLVGGGTTWFLAGLLALAAPPHGSTPLIVVLSVVLQHALAGGVAVAAGLFGVRLVRWWDRAGPMLIARGALAVASLTLVVGTPPVLAGAGWTGLLNEVAGELGIGGAWGIAPPVGGLALALRWSCQLLLVGGFGAWVALAPARIRSLFVADDAVQPSVDGVTVGSEAGTSASVGA